MNSGNDCGFKCAKYTMVVLFAIDIIGKVAFLGLSVTALVTLAQIEQKDGTTKADIDSANKMCKVTFAIVAVSLVLSVIGLVGVVKEHQTTLILLTVLSCSQVVYIILNTKHTLIPLILGVLVSIMTGLYTYMIVQKNRYNQNTSHVKFTI